METKNLMGLNTFVKETLLQIANAVAEANKELSVKTGIEPEAQRSWFSLQMGGNNKGASGVHFDVAVTTQTSDEGGGSATLKLAVVGAILGGATKESAQAVSRVQFSVAVDQHITYL